MDLAPFLGLPACALAGGLGYWLGMRHERERAAEEAERLLRLDPPDRTEGLPTNLDAEPSEVKAPRIARSHLMR